VSALHTVIRGSSLVGAWSDGILRRMHPAVQSASDVYAPASGEVLEVNSSLVEDPSLVRHALRGIASCLIAP